MEQSYQDPGDELEQFDDTTPEEVEEDEPQEPQLVRVRMNGKTVMVTEEVADLIHERELEQQRVISRMGTELGTLRKQPQETRQTAADTEENPDLEWFTSPSKAAAAAEERAYQRIQAELDRKDAQRKYWGKFYSTNKDLADHEEVVQFVVQKHFDELKDLTPSDSQREIAAKTKAFLGRSQGGKTLPNRPATSERSANPAPQRTQPAEAAPQRRYIGLSAELAAQAERKRRARYNVPKDSK